MADGGASDAVVGGAGYAPLTGGDPGTCELRKMYFFPELRGLGIQEWLSFYFKSPMSAPGLYPEHDLFIQLMKLKNTLRHLKGEELITHLGLEYYD